MKKYFVDLSNRLLQIYDVFRFIVEFIFVDIIFNLLVLILAGIYMDIYPFVFIVLGMFDLIYWILAFHFWLFLGKAYHPMLSKRLDNGWFGRLNRVCSHRFGG
jgi:hypothetical protein